MNVVTDMLLDVAGSIGTDSFYCDIMRGMFGTVTSDNCQVIYYPGRDRPEYVVDYHTPEHLRGLYREFCQFDPFYLDWCSTHRAGLRLLSDVQPLDYDEGGYNSGFYSITSCKDELDLMFAALVGSAIGVFAQRSRAHDDNEIEPLSMLFPILRRLHATHRRQLFRVLAADHADADLYGVAISKPSGRLPFASKALRAVAGQERAATEAARCHAAAGSMTAPTRIGPASVTDLREFPLALSARLIAFGRCPARAGATSTARWQALARACCARGNTRFVALQSPVSATSILPRSSVSVKGRSRTSARGSISRWISRPSANSSRSSWTISAMTVAVSAGRTGTRCLISRQSVPKIRDRPDPHLRFDLRFRKHCE